MEPLGRVATVTKALQAQLLVASILSVNFRAMIPAPAGHIALVYGPVTMPTAGRPTISMLVVRDEVDSVPAAILQKQIGNAAFFVPPAQAFDGV